jgi:hypothetical protein
MTAAAFVSLLAMAPSTWAARTTPAREPSTPVYVLCKQSATKGMDRLARIAADVQIGISAMKANVQPDGHYRRQDVLETRNAMHKLRVFMRGQDDPCIGVTR